MNHSFTNSEVSSLRARCLRQPPRRFIHLLLLLLLCHGLYVTHAQAQTALCIPPLQTSGPITTAPNWFDAMPPQPSFSRRITDPRWGPAVSNVYGAGTAGLASFRAINDGTFIYLSWRVEVDPSLDNDRDELFVVFGSTSATPSATDPDVRIRIRPFSSSAAPLEAAAIGGASGGEVRVWTRTSAGGSFVPITGANPSWLTNTVRVWLVNTGTFSWAINMRVKRINSGAGETVPADGILIDSDTNDFKMWYEMRMTIDASGSPACTSDPAACFPVSPYAFPRTSVITGSGTSTVFPDRAAWGDFHMKTSAADTAPCSDVGVSLTTNNIGTTNSPASRFNVSASGSSVNTLFALPFNKSGTTIPVGGIRATYSIANWGTLPNREDVTDPTQLWRVIPGSETGIPNDTAITNNMPATVTDFDFPWDVQDVGGANPFQFKTKFLCAPPLDPAAEPSQCLRQHQCMMVELSSGLPLTFINKVAFRNMDYNLVASRFERGAEVSVVGLNPIPSGGPRRDVYLFVQTINMPEKVTPGGGRPTTLAAASSPRPGNDPPEEVMIETQPTYRVFAWHATGQTDNAAGIDQIIVRPQTSFGYFIRHDGELEGWRHSLEGAQKIGPNLYKIAVPNNSNVQIKTIIEAVEPGTTPPGFRRWGLSLHAGASIPHGGFGNVFDPGPNAGFDLEYRINPNFSLEGIYTFHRFRGQTFGTFTINDLNLHQFSLNGKVYGSTSPTRPFFNFGGGAYKFDPGSTRGGVNIGGGVQFDVAPNIAVDAMYNFHNVFTSGSSTKFSTVQGGVRFRF